MSGGPHPLLHLALNGPFSPSVLSVSSVVASRFLEKPSRMPAQVIGDEGLDEVVTVVVTRMHAQLEGLARCAARVGEQVGVQLLGQEFVRSALVEQDRAVERPPWSSRIAPSNGRCATSTVASYSSQAD